MIFFLDTETKQIDNFASLLQHHSFNSFLCKAHHIIIISSSYHISSMLKIAILFYRLSFVVFSAAWYWYSSHVYCCPATSSQEATDVSVRSGVYQNLKNKSTNQHIIHHIRTVRPSWSHQFTFRYSLQNGRASTPSNAISKNVNVLEAISPWGREFQFMTTKGPRSLQTVKSSKSRQRLLWKIPQLNT